MRRKSLLLLFAIAVAVAAVVWPTRVEQTGPEINVTRGNDTATVARQPQPVSEFPSFLPREAHDTLRLIAQGGPFLHRQDGQVFANREGLLPHRQHGYYREYTVDTPAIDHRGARRIVTGGDPPQAWYYTHDHYDSFRAFDVRALERQR